jgi:hypothetical protein
VQEKWHSFQIEGWGGFVIKEKLKLIKSTLKEWHLVHTKNIPGRIYSIKAWLSELDDKGEENELSVEEIEDLSGITHDIHYLSCVTSSISWQQS